MTKRPIFITVVSLLALTGCKEKVSPAETAAHLATARELYAKKDYPQALTEIQGALKGDPRSGDAHYLAAQIQEGLGNQKAAFEEYARAAVPDANNLKAQLKVVEILTDAKQYDAALGRINGTLGSHPNDPDALALRASIEQRQGSRDKARADAQAALGRAPGQPVATAVLAAEALTSKNNDKALELIDAGLKKHPDEPMLVRLRAVALLAQDRKDDAISIYTGLVKDEPDSARNRAALAELDAQAGQVDEGERVLRDGVKAYPDKSDIHLALIAYLNRYRGAETAGTELQAAIAAHPGETGFDQLRAEQLLRAGHPDQALAALEAAATRVPEGPARQAVQLGQARLEADQGDAGAARKLLDTILAAKSDNDDALLLRAMLALRANEAARAVPDLLAVAGRQPRNVAPFSLLADAYGQQGDLDKTIDALKKVVYFQPKEIGAAVRLSEAGLKANKPDVAKAALSDFVTRNPDSIEGRAALVHLAFTQKDWPAAQAAIDGLRRNPKGDQAVAILTAQLAEAKGQPAAAMPAYAKQLDPVGGKALNRDALQGYARSAVAAKQADAAIATVSTLAGQLTGADAAAANLILAALYKTQDKPDQASAAASAAIAAAPKEAGGYLDLSSQQRGNQSAQAIATLNNGLKAGAPVEPLLLARAAIQDSTGDKDAALASYREVLKSNPRSAVAANNFASLVADVRPTDTAALEEARRPMQRLADVSNPAILDTIAWLDYRLGNLQSAKDLLVRAKADSSPNPQLRYHYGAVLIALGDKDAGRSAVKAALAQPSFPGHEDAARLLTE